VCVAGACRHGCWAGGLLHPVDGPSQLGPCLGCVAGQPLALAPAPIGTPCDEGVCVDGACVDGCVVDGAWVAPWVELDGEPCRWCAPNQTRNDLVARRDGTACGEGRVCAAGECRAGCVVDGHFFAPSEGPTGDPCNVCDPAVALEALTPVAAGVACGDGEVCAFGVCLAGCVIDGLVYQADAQAAAAPCLQCRPERATDRWSARDDGAACGGPNRCRAGACEPP